MNANLIIGIVGLIIGIVGLMIGVSGWVSVIYTRRSNTEAARIRLADDLDRLDRLIGKWMDRIAEITLFSSTFKDVAGRIEEFNKNQGGFETQVAQVLGALPNEARYDKVRNEVELFRTDAFTTKGGLLGHLSYSGHPPFLADWPGRRDKALEPLRDRCRMLKALLQDESKRLRDMTH